MAFSDVSGNGLHAKPGDILVGRLQDPIGMYRDEVFLRDLSSWCRDVLHRAMLDATAACRKDPAPGHLDGCIDGMEPIEAPMEEAE